MRIPKGPRWNRFAAVRLRDAAWAEQLSFVGTIDEVVEDIIVATWLGANEVLIDLNLHEGFTQTDRMLDTAGEIYQRAARALA